MSSTIKLNLQYTYEEKLAACYRQGMANSTDERTRLGAIIVCDGWDIARGVNEHMPGFNAQKAPEKYWYIEHAERNAIWDLFRQPKIHEYIPESIMFAPWVACPDCARAIVKSGIRTVVCHHQCMQRTPAHWKEQVDAGLAILHKGGVLVIEHCCEINEGQHLMNGEYWTP